MLVRYAGEHGHTAITAAPGTMPARNLDGAAHEVKDVFGVRDSISALGDTDTATLTRATQGVADRRAGL